MAKNRHTAANVKRAIESAAQDGNIHPIFDTVSIYSHSPMYECDYNFHKSNSTFFNDLDESRTTLMTKLYLPGMASGSKQLEKEGYMGKTNIILGAVHTSFHKEISPYEQYEVRSRVLGWNEKWCVIGSFFIRPARKGKEEVLLASSLSKYVVKKGRFTVMPERCFTNAGWLPQKPDDCQAGPKTRSQEGSGGSEATVVLADHQRNQPEMETETVSADKDHEDIAAPVPEPLTEPSNVVENLEKVASRITSNSTQPTITAMTPPRAAEWDWHRIDMERIRGLRIVSAWLSLDKDLMDEFLQRDKAE